MSGKKRILVVDDEPIMLEILREVLEGNGYEVAEAHNGVEALEKVGQLPPQLVISDIVMPQMDGFSLFKALRENGRTTRIPIMIITVRDKMMDTFSALGADEVVLKPYFSQVVLDKVAGLLSKPLSDYTAPKLPASAYAPPKRETVPPKSARRKATPTSIGSLAIGIFIGFVIAVVLFFTYVFLTSVREGNTLFKRAVQTDV